MSNTAMCWPVVPCSDAVINAVIYWSVRCLSPHLTEAGEGQYRLSASPEGRRAVIWAAFQCPGPASHPAGMYTAHLLCPEEQQTHAGVKWDQEWVLCGNRLKWRSIWCRANAYLQRVYISTVFTVVLWRWFQILHNAIFSFYLCKCDCFTICTDHLYLQEAAVVPWMRVCLCVGFLNLFSCVLMDLWTSSIMALLLTELKVHI